jgi:DNA-binding transcriptional LysR family regulator
MELRHLRYYVAIAEERSFTRAAERLWVAQPGLSSQIRRLESELGVKLFERHTRGVDLTAAGEVFLQRARVVLATAEAAQSVGQDIQQGQVGSIRLGIGAVMGWSLASSLLEGFAQGSPGVEVAVVESQGGTLVRELRDGRLDAVLAPAMFGSPELFRTRLTSEPWVVLAAATHRLGEVAGSVAAHQLEDERVIVTGQRDGLAYDQAVFETLAALGVRPEPRRGGPGPALFGPVAAGEAVALATAPISPFDHIVARPLDAVQEVEFALMWHDETPVGPLADLILAAKAVAEPSTPVLRAAA